MTLSRSAQKLLHRLVPTLSISIAHPRNLASAPSESAAEVIFRRARVHENQKHLLVVAIGKCSQHSAKLLQKVSDMTLAKRLILMHPDEQ